MLADGGTTISDLAVLRHQPELFGPVASTATAWRVVDRVDDRLLAGLHSARATARERISGCRPRTPAGYRPRRPPADGGGRGSGSSSTPPWSTPTATRSLLGPRSSTPPPASSAAADNVTFGSTATGPGKTRSSPPSPDSPRCRCRCAQADPAALQQRKGGEAGNLAGWSRLPAATQRSNEAETLNDLPSRSC